MNKEKFVELANQRFKEAREFWSTWKAGAIDDFAFVAGRQWAEEDERILADQQRPVVTFNYSEKMVDAVVGAEVANRHEVVYKPRGIEDAPVAELWTNAARYVRDECSAEEEETDAFRDMLICGMGWTHTTISYERNLDGDIQVKRIDPTEMLSDPAASRPGIRDRRYHFHLAWINEKDVKDRWPDAQVGDEDSQPDRGMITRGHRYEDQENETAERNRHKGQVQLRHYECLENTVVYRVADQSGMLELSKEQFDQVRDQIEQFQIPYSRQTKKVYYYAWFANDRLLEWGESPSKEGFTYTAMTCKRDRNKNSWYGLSRVMKDPQRWANKWLSQILHIINSNAKGGLLAEIGAFVDPKKAQEEWSSADSLTLLNEGAIDKIKEKQIAQYPAGLDKLMNFALGSLPMVTGINLEALGLANRDQAGIVENSRKQAAYGLLTPMFDALRRYRKEQGKVLLFFIREFIADNRLIRIGGPESEQYVPLTKIPDDVGFDIIVEQSPSAPDVKERTWEAMQAMLPPMMKAGYPIPPDILDYSPLPVGLAQKWKQFAAGVQQQDQKLAEENQKLKEANESLKKDRELKMQEIQDKRDLMEAEFELKRRQAELELEQKRLEFQAEMEMKQMQFQADLQMQQQTQQHQMRLQHDKTRGELAIKGMAEGIDGFDLPAPAHELEDAIAGLKDALAKMAQQHQQTTAQLAAIMTSPRRLIRDAMGNPVGSELVPTTMQ